MATNDLVNPSPGYLLAVLVLLTAHSLGQILPAGPAEAYGNAAPPYKPITSEERLHWMTDSTIGPQNLAAGLFTAGFGTARNSPREYGPHWDGFGKRYGMRLTGIVTGNAMEATLGSLWGEDPRYFSATGRPFQGRLKNVVLMTFLARRADGHMAPAYARFMGNAGNNFLSNTWRADSESGTGDACLRIALGIAGRMGSNAFAEFWPSARKHLFHRK